MSTDGARDAPGSQGRTVDLTIFVLALALRVAVVLVYQRAHPHAEHLVIDEQSYDEWARRIASGEWIGRGVFFQEPLYPYALGLLYKVFGPERLVARLAQCVLGALTAVLCGWIARRVFGCKAGIATGVLMAVYWPALFFPCLLLKENLFLPLFAALALCLVRTLQDGARTRDWLEIGVLTGLGALLRGNMLLLAPLFVLWPVARAMCERTKVRQAFASGAWVLGGLVLVLAPVALRNRAVGGVFALTTSGAGTNLYGGNNRENPYGRATEVGFIRGIPEYEAGDWAREAERRSGRKLDPGEVSTFWRNEVWRSVREDPALHLRILWNKLRLTLGWYEVPDNHLLYWDASYVSLAQLPFPRFGLVGVLGLAGILFALAQRRMRSARIPGLVLDSRAAMELTSVFALYLVTIVLTVTSDRGRYPLAPLLTVFGGFMIVALASSARARAWTSLAWCAGALIVGTLVVHTPVLSAADLADDWDEREYNLAVQERDEPGKLDDARAIAAGLVERHPQSARSRLLLAELDYRRAHEMTADGDARAARSRSLTDTLGVVEHLLGVESLKARDRYQAQRLAAWIELDLGRWAHAVRHFREARTFAPRLDDDHGRLLALLSDLSPEDRDLRYREAQRELESYGYCGFGLPRPPIAWDITLARARMEYELGTSELEQGAPRESAQAKIASALESLERLVHTDGVPPPIVRRARVQAGWIQHYLKNDKAAENQFRAALEIGVDNEAKLGLAYALYNRIVSETQDPARGARVDELRGLIQQLSSTEPVDPRVEALSKRVAALRRYH